MEFDFVVVGAGSAGCAVADRLSASGRDTALVVEAGGSDRRPSIKVPIGYGLTIHDERVKSEAARPRAFWVNACRGAPSRAAE